MNAANVLATLIARITFMDRSARADSAVAKTIKIALLPAMCSAINVLPWAALELNAADATRLQIVRATQQDPFVLRPIISVLAPKLMTVPNPLIPNVPPIQELPTFFIVKNRSLLSVKSCATLARYL
jgi:hypothetical protein